MDGRMAHVLTSSNLVVGDVSMYLLEPNCHQSLPAQDAHEVWDQTVVSGMHDEQETSTRRPWLIV